jgi:CheY-like chemotaxis protein
MEEGTFKFSPETIDLVSIGRNVVGELFNHARSKNLHLDFNTPVESLEATGNNLLTTSIVENLVRNAMEAAPENSTVTMALYQGARVGLLIHNEGVVHESIRKDFFKKYATHGKRGGLGLGTYSARLIARAQGGDLTMTTSDERGTLLILKLNRRENGTIKDDENHVIPESFGPSLPGNLVDMALPSKSRSKQLPIEILVVEDDDYNWMLLSCWLPRHSGVRRVINGREAIEALNVRRPDIVIMDIEMPIMTGFEAVYQIREMQKSVAEEPSMIYAFTGYDDIETTESIKNAGFDGILKKPITQKEIEELLSTYALEKAASKIENRLWIERSFMEAFPSFIESRRSLIDDIERSAESGDISNMKRAAHTLLGSPAVHGFEEGIAICKEISKLETIKDLSLVRSHVSSLRKILSNPVIR